MDAARASVATHGKVTSIVALLRPHQWLKNGVVLAPLVFAHRLLDPNAVALALVAFVACCAISSAGYVLNDLLDVELDRLHPTKRARPLAAGTLTPTEGGAVLVAVAMLGLGVSLALGPDIAALNACYLALQYVYSRVLKRIVVLDVIVVAVGFIMRAYVGGLAIDVSVSPWLALVTFLLALFLALNRRRQELVALGPGAAAHRGVLADYTPALLDQMIAPVTAATLVAYMIYSVSPEVTERLGTHWVHLTVPFVVFGMFRYLYLVHRHQAGEDPARVLLADRPLLASVLLWIAADLVLLYGRQLLGG
jgi:4-hydroxybenzoate polyprenyltransferase